MLLVLLSTVPTVPTGQWSLLLRSYRYGTVLRYSTDLVIVPVPKGTVTGINTDTVPTVLIQPCNHSSIDLVRYCAVALLLARYLSTDLDYYGTVYGTVPC